MNERIKVWDPIVRSTHWLLLTAFVISYLTGENESDFHFYAGYFIIALVVLRIIWGFVGTEHARFRNFAASPVAAIGYVKGLVTGNVKHYLGHNPAAAVMSFSLLTAVILVAGAGLTLHGLRGHGPLAFALAQPGVVLGEPTEAEVRAFRERRERIARGGDDEDEEHERREAVATTQAAAGAAAGDTPARPRVSPEQRQKIRTMKEVHEVLVNLTILLIILHVAGVLASSFRHRENLVKSMIDGFKVRPAETGSGSTK